MPTVEGKPAWTGPTQDTPVTAGLIQQVIPEDTDGIVQFGSGGMMIPADFGYESRVTIYERPSEEFPGLPQELSPIVEFALEVKENGVWVKKSQLSHTVTIGLSYSLSNLPAEFDENLLGVAIFSEELGTWVFNNATVVDKENKIIFVETDHLTPYVVGINPQIDDFAEDFGFTAKHNRYAQERKNIHIEESSGNLGIKFKDFSLPTPGNLEFGITRIYNTRAAEVDQITELNVKDDSVRIILCGESQIQPVKFKTILHEDQCFAAFGDGWRLNLPYICSKAHLHDFTGRAQQLEENIWWWDDHTKKECHGLTDFTVEKRDENHIVITLKNGIRMTFEKVVKTITYETDNEIEKLVLRQGRVTKIEELTTGYSQEISYTDHDSKFLIKLDKIKDSFDRELSFSYGASGISEVVLSIPGEDPQTILSYTYNEARSELRTAINNLTKAKDVYDYETKTVRRGQTVDGWGVGFVYFDRTKIKGMKRYDVRALKRITDELQRQDLFAYDVMYFDNRETIPTFGIFNFNKYKYKSYYDLFLVNKSQQSAGNEIRNEQKYSYDFEMIEIGDHSDFKLRLKTSTFSTGEAKTLHHFTEKGEQNCLTKKAIYLGDDLVEQEKFDYGYYGKNPGGEIWRINRYEYFVNGSTTIEGYEYDNWGNISRKTSTGGVSGYTGDDFTEWIVYANTNPVAANIDGMHSSPYDSSVPGFLHDRPVRRVKLVHTPVDRSGNPGAYLQEEAYRYDAAAGRMDRSAVLDGSHWLETQYLYDEGAIKPRQVINPLGQSVYYTYDVYGNITKIERNVIDVDDESQTITLEWGYDPVWGWKLWEKDGRGYTTVYRYIKLDGSLDYKGRVRKIEFPDDRDQPGWDPRTGTGRSGNPVRSIDYDDEQLTKTVIDQMGNKIIYQYDSFGTLASIIKSQKTEGGLYEPYAATNIEYNTMGKISAIEDALGNTTCFQYNDLGDLTRIIYPGPGNPEKLISYDYHEGNVIVTNERGFETIESRDALGRIIVQKVRNADGYRTAITQWFYDGAGNLVRKIDPVESETLYCYDHLGRQTKTIFPLESFWENERKVELQPIIRYEYNDIGQKTAEERDLPSGTVQRIEYLYDSMGRLIHTSTTVTDRFGDKQTVETKTYYDANGNKVRVVDANNAGLLEEEQKATTYEYSARNLLLSETDPAGNTISYTYNAVGNQTSVTDPRGNSGKYSGDFTTGFEYDDLYRVIREYLPDASGQGAKPVIEYSYDLNGNLKTRIEPDGRKTTYTYWPRGWVKTITVEGGGRSYTEEYTYDATGNEIEIKDAGGFVTEKEYDALNRLVKVIHPEGNTEQFLYDLKNNQTAMINGRYARTEYVYDRYNRLKEVSDSKGNKTIYYYDRWGNMTRTVNAMDYPTDYQYDELNRMIAEIDSLKHIKRYGYDLTGNLIWSQDPNGTESFYEYSPHNLLKKLTLTNNGKMQVVEYQYDEAGNRITARNDAVVTRYNTVNGEYAPDPYSRVLRESKSFEGKTFHVEYEYDVMGRVTGVEYPTGNQVNYVYNNLGQLTSVPGYIEENPAYNPSGLLAEVKAANNITTSWTYDQNNRVCGLSHNNAEAMLKTYDFQYDGAGNIIRKNDDFFQYDSLNQLIFANLRGKFPNTPTDEEQIVCRTGSDLDNDGIIAGTEVNSDYSGNERLERIVDQTRLIELDYAGGSIGVDLEETVKVSKIILTPETTTLTRVHDYPRSLIFYTSFDNINYEKIEDWELLPQTAGGLMLVLKEPVSARFVKVKCIFNDRDKNYLPINLAEFVNSADEIIKVYYYVEQRYEEYTYDQAGNRKTEIITEKETVSREYIYYPNSNRLLSNGKYAFAYDNNGNLIKKGKTVYDCR